MANAKTEIQHANALLTLFVKTYNAKYVSPLVLNRYKEKFGMVDVVQSVGYDRAQELIKYYFTTKKQGHPIKWFFYNFDGLDKTLRELAEDSLKRESLRAETARRVAEWEERNSELGIRTN